MNLKHLTTLAAIALTLSVTLAAGVLSNLPV